MRWSRARVCAALIAAAPLLARAGYELIGAGNEDGGSHLADPKTIVRQGELVKVWVLFKYPHAPLPKFPDNLPNPTYVSAKALFFVDCVGRRTSLQQVVYYADADGKGKIRYHYKAPTLELSDPIPGSIAADILELDSVCARAPPAPPAPTTRKLIRPPDPAF